jgi:hypothetical protein
MALYLLLAITNFFVSATSGISSSSGRIRLKGKDISEIDCGERDGNVSPAREEKR